MAPSEAQKRASAKWDKKNVTTLGCKVKKEQAEAFKEYASNRGKTANTMLKDYVLDCIGERDTAQEPDTANPQNADLPKPESFKKSEPYKQESDLDWLKRLNKNSRSYDDFENDIDSIIEPPADTKPDDDNIPESIRLAQELMKQRKDKGNPEDGII